MAALLAGLMSVGGVQTAAATTPTFKLPFECGTIWHASTYASGTHGPNNEAVDLNNYVDYQPHPTYDLGAPVLASADGTATSGTDPSGLGNYITISHGGGWATDYGHLNTVTLSTASDRDNSTPGIQVYEGDQIGTVGSTGDSTAPHLHYVQKKLNVNTGTYVGKEVKIDGSAIAVAAVVTHQSPTPPRMRAPTVASSGRTILVRS
ncbi:MAG: M23 family metallopeptidase [Actinomycetia bacterium]|nr:M23 family metallopeptidase [Actinomycetes bacterium]